MPLARIDVPAGKSADYRSVIGGNGEAQYAN